MAGVNSTLVLEPDGRSSITLDMSGTASDYRVRPDSLRLNTGKRMAVAYTQSPLRDGGDVSGIHGPLVPVTFTVDVIGSTRAEMIQRAQTLLQAITSDRWGEGGYLRYKPEGVGVSVPDTYYRYLPSEPPKLVARKDNTWDGEKKNVAGAGNVFVLSFEVALQTQPHATSDPGNPNSLTLSDSTLENTRDGTRSNELTILSSEIIGDQPALVQVALTNSAAVYVGRLYCWLRSSLFSTLANVVCVREAEDATASGGWAQQADAARSNGNYMRTSTDGQTLRFSLLSDLADHEGKISVLAIVRETGTKGQANKWKVRAEIVSSGNLDYPITTGDYQYANTPDAWTIVGLGDFDFPPVVLSDDAGGDVAIILRCIEITDGESFDVDAIVLVFHDDSAIYVDVKDERTTYGVAQSFQLLIENLDSELTQVIDGSGNFHVYRAAHGKFLTLTPGFDHKLYLLWERIVSDSPLYFTHHIHVPDDQLTVAVKAIYRTIFPFREAFP